MDFFYNTFIKDLLRFRRDATALLLWLGIPILIGGLMSLMAGGGNGVKPQAFVLVADQDQSFLSDMLIGALNQNSEGVFRAEEVDEAEGRARMEEGEASALLIIPEGFSQALLKETPTTLKLVKNPSQRILPLMVEEALSMLSDSAFYVHRVAGDQLKKMATGPPEGQTTFSSLEVAAMAVRLNQIGQRLSKSLDPLLIELKIEEETKEFGADNSGEAETAQPGFLALFMPGILFMTFLFMAQGISQDLWKERNGRTLQRAASAPRLLAGFVLGKAAAGLFVMFVVSLSTLIIGYAYMGFRWSTLPLSVLWCMVAGLLLLSLMCLLQSFSSTSGTGNLLSMVLLFPLMMLGGSFFPFEAMPQWMSELGQMTPNGYALARLKDILFRAPSLSSLALGSFVLIAISGFFLMIVSQRMKKWAAA